MNWRRLLSTRSIIASIAGVTALVFVIWFDGVGLWAFVVVLIASTLMVLEWVFANPKRRSRRPGQVSPGDVDYKRRFWN
jgi:hypothetical protein